MRVREKQAPETMPTILQDFRIEPSAVNEGYLPSNDSIVINPPCQDFFCGTGGILHGADEGVSLVKHYTSRTRLRQQQGARDYWQGVYGAGAERASCGGVTWL